jgi:hypothetical protein
MSRWSLGETKIVARVVVSSKEGRERENEREKMLSEIGRRGRDRPRSCGQRFHTKSVESTPPSKKRKESGRKKLLD